MLRPIIDKYGCNELGEIFNSKTGRKLHTFKGRDGYYRVSLFINGKAKTYMVHRLVLSAFISNPDPERYTEINHIDGNKNNNALDNLEWCDRGYNQRHAYRNGLKSAPKGVKNGRSKLTDQDVSEIRELLKVLPQKEIAKLYGVCKSTISAIKNRVHWAEVGQV